MCNQCSHATTHIVEPSFQRFVMLIESDTDLAWVLREILKDQQLSTLWARTRDDALHMTEELTPLLFIMNQRLRDGDGLKLYDELHRRSHLSHVPALILSSDITLYQSQFEQRDIVALDMPIDLDYLIDSIRSAVLT